MSRPRSRGRGAVAAALATTLLAAAALGLGACGPAPTPPSLGDLPVVTVSLGSRELVVAVADTPTARTRGLAGIRDLGGLDGLLFAFEAPAATAFTMRDTLIPLDLAFVDAGGRVLAILSMEPCAADPCPTYQAPAPYRWAIETPAGGLDGIEVGDAFVLPE